MERWVSRYSISVLQGNVSVKLVRERQNIITLSRDRCRQHLSLWGLTFLTLLRPPTTVVNVSLGPRLAYMRTSPTLCAKSTRILYHTYICQNLKKLFSVNFEHLNDYGYCSEIHLAFIRVSFARGIFFNDLLTLNGNAIIGNFTAPKTTCWLTSFPLDLIMISGLAGIDWHTICMCSHWQIISYHYHLFYHSPSLCSWTSTGFAESRILPHWILALYPKSDHDECWCKLLDWRMQFFAVFLDVAYVLSFIKIMQLLIQHTLAYECLNWCWIATQQLCCAD